MSKSNGPDHLVKILAERGVASRRASEKIIRDGQVTVDGAVLSDPGARVVPRAQTILMNGEKLPPPPRMAYYVMHKPKGVITSRKDPDGRRTIFDLIPDAPLALATVGRLDYGSEGVLLLTTDGEMGFRLTHPSYGVPKSYLVKVSGTPNERKMTQLSRGVKLEDGNTRPALVTMVVSKGPSSWLLITLHEGRNRIIRRMMDHIGHNTLKLKRIGFGGITLRGLDPGDVRELTKGELSYLKRQVAEPGAAELKVTFEVRKAVAEALRLPLPERERSEQSRSRDSEGRPYRKKGWARPKGGKGRASGSRRGAKGAVGDLQRGRKRSGTKSGPNRGGPKKKR